MHSSLTNNSLLKNPSIDIQIIVKIAILQRMNTEKQFAKTVKLTEIFSTKIWKDVCNNANSVDLMINWTEIFTSFSRCINLNKDCSNHPNTIVVPAPTGTGKTLAMEYYASQLDGDTGILIVTFLKDEATKIVENINRWADQDKAIAFHSDNRLTRTDLKNHQVLVITHKGLQIALDQQNRYGDENKIKHLYDYGTSGRRELIIIDEEMDHIISTELQINDVNALLGTLESYERLNSVSNNIKKDISSLKALMNVFKEAKEALEIPLGPNDPGVPDIGQPIHIQQIRESLLLGHTLALEATQKLLNTGEFYAAISTHNSNNNKVMINIIDSIASIMEADWAYYYIDHYGKSKIRTARSTRLKDMSCVVLDATASANNYYKLQSDVDMRNLSNKVRTYKNVTLHTSKDWRTGKAKMCTKENAYKYLQEVNNNNTFSNAKIALFTHQKLRGIIEDNYPDQINNISLGHFNALTGVNNYRDCNTLYIFGILHKPKPVYTDLHTLSVRGLDCFNDNQVVKDERTEMEYSLISCDIVQMINRVSCRRVIDAEGNCPDTKVYLTLPKNNALANIIISNIQIQMPGIVIKDDWEFNPSPANKPGPVSKYDDLVLDKLILSTDKIIPFSLIAKELEIKQGVQDTLRARLKANANIDPLIKNLIDNNIKFKKQGRSWVFIKD